MTWVAVAVAGTAVVGAVVSSDASDKASKAQQQSSDKAILAQQAQSGQTRADNAQFLQTGTIANKRLASLLGLSPGGPSAGYDGALVDTSSGMPTPVAKLYATDPTYKKAWDDYAAIHKKRFGQGFNQNSNASNIESEIRLRLPQTSAAQPADTATDTLNSPLLRKFTANDLNADPVYNAGLKFGLDRGTEGINSRATASGMYDSGATLKALTQFGTDYGSTKANESYNRFTNDQGNMFNKLSGISGTGQVATNQVGAAGTNAANNISNDITGAGNARAAGIVGGANAWGNAGAGISSAAVNYQNNQTLQALLRKQNSGNASSGYGGYSNDQLYAG